MPSSPKEGPLSRWASASSATTACESPIRQSHNTGRRQTWASATWATGQNFITGMLNHHKDNHSTQQYDDPYYQKLPQQHEVSTPLPLSAPLSQPSPATDRSTQTPIVRHRPLELPPIPRLLGNDNLDEWDDVLVRTLRLHGLAEYVKLPFPGVPEPTEDTTSGLTPEQWARDRSLICLLIVGSISTDVRDTILASGYEPGETNPKVLYDLIRDAVPRACGEDAASCLRELNTISPGESRFGGSLRGYGLRLGYLRRRLYVSEPQPNDNLVLVMAVLGLAREETYEELSMDLGRELERGTLSWVRFMGDLAAVHGREVADRRRSGRGKGVEGVV